jgi:hypothetical protein
MVNRCESPINVVRPNKPKMLIGLDQKVRGQDRLLSTQPAQSRHLRQIGET